MDYDLINNIIIRIFKEYDIYSFPLDCFNLLKSFNISFYQYSSLSGKLAEYSIKCSNDAYCYKDKIFYNDRVNKNRVNFSLMHELGHIALNHGKIHTLKKEQEANYFASHILAPRMTIHYSGCRNYIDVAKMFNISREAAQYAFDDYRRWHRRAVYRMSSLDKAMYSHFYDEEYKEFVYSRKPCVICGKELINERSKYCSSCFNRLSYIDYAKDNVCFLVAEENWLYGGIQ